jgi:hypothetical protein
LLEIKKINSFHFRTNLIFETKKENKPFLRHNIFFENDFIKNSNSKWKAAGNFTLRFDFKEKKFFLRGENRIIDSISFFKLTTLPDNSFLETIKKNNGFDFFNVQNQWFKLEEVESEIVNEGDVGVESEIKEKGVEFKNFLDSLADVKIIKIFPEEEVRGIKMKHYLIALEKEKTKKALEDIIFFARKFLGPEALNSLGILDDLSPRLNEFLEITDDLLAEVWLGKKDNYLYRFKLEKEIGMFQLKEEGKKFEISNLVPAFAKLKFDLEFSDFNKNFKIDPPSDYRRVEEIISF